MNQTILIFTLDNGHKPFFEWLNSLKDKRTQAKINARIANLRLGNFGDCKPVGDGVLELRIDYGPGYRVYFARQGDSNSLLLLGGDKGSQQTDIKRAKEYWQIHKQRGN